jgi:hypothetical protein
MFFPLVFTGAMVLSQTKSLPGENMDILEPLEVAKNPPIVDN